MFNESKAREIFSKHVATLTDAGNIKILDFKAPDTNGYRIRFIFEEDFCKLTITGDLGHLVATNYCNMTYEKFKSFVNNTGYFMGKVECHDRPFFFWDRDAAEKEILEIVNDPDNGWIREELIRMYDYLYDVEEEAVNSFIEDVLEDFSDESGIGPHGYELLCQTDSCELIDDASSFGKKETDILQWYMLAYKLAREQLEKESAF